MIRHSFHEDWRVSDGRGNLAATFMGKPGRETPVTLPHDAMILEKRQKDTKNENQTGFYPGGIYHYKKRFAVPKEWERESVVLELEGAYTNAKVYINGDYAGGHPNGYSNFYVAMDHFLRYGEENEVKVIVNNAMEQNSRWYSGSGLYRNVKLLRGGILYIPQDGVRITTPEIGKDIAVVSMEIDLKNRDKGNHQVEVITEIQDRSGKIINSHTSPATVFGETGICVRQRISVMKPELWDCEHPSLYTCKVKVIEGSRILDECEEHFGIRRLQLDAQNGLRINGQEVKLRGACIHHDNGIIGACTLKRAEERRCEQLKDAGFNCIRSSHHPISKAMLDACDRIGMLVIDELSDMWNCAKNSHDYSMYFQEYWEKDVELMVSKDFNHPSVILYCMGNEIQEAGTAKGAELNRRIHNKFKILDPTRYTTNALNGMIAASDSMGEIIASILGKSKEELAQASTAGETKTSEAGSSGLNNMMSMLRGPMADAMAVHPLMTETLKEIADGMDVVGYNYLTARHEYEHQQYPDRIILGTETFPSDIVRLWDIAKRNHHVLGDMTWTGYDYLGEAGIGIFYYDGTMNFSAHWPDRVAYVGDIDLTGYRRPISYLREIVYGLRDEPYIAVGRMNRNGQTPNTTPWMWKDNIASWTWNGHEGDIAQIDVYGKTDEVELFLNGISVGRKESGEAAGYVSVFEVPYEAGELKAVSYLAGKEISSFTLRTAMEEIELTVETDRLTIKADGEDLSYITISLKDKNGTLNMNAAKEVTLHVEGAGTLEGFGSADPQALTGYREHTQNIYDGRLLAAIRAGVSPGDIIVTAEAEECESVKIIISCC